MKENGPIPPVDRLKRSYTGWLDVEYAPSTFGKRLKIPINAEKQVYFVCDFSGLMHESLKAAKL